MNNVNTSFYLVFDKIIELQTFFLAEAWNIGKVVLLISILSAAVNYAMTGTGLKENVIKLTKAILFFVVVMNVYPNIISWITSYTYNLALGSTASIKGSVTNMHSIIRQESLDELRLFIERGGGKVGHAVAMATGRSGREIAPSPGTIKTLVDKYDTDTLSFFLKEVGLYDGNIKALTEPEARALRRAPSLDEARNRILAARRQGNTSMDTRSPQKDEYQAPQISPLDMHHRRKFRR